MRGFGNDLDQRNRPAILLEEIDDMVDHGLLLVRRHWLWLAADHRAHLA
jgi:hypothetical protein